MLQIQQVTTDPYQKQTLLLPSGGEVVIVMRFVPMQYSWKFESLTYNSFLLENLRITNSPNMLHQFRNQIPFGIACFSTANREPSQQQDFSSRASILYILSATEVIQYGEFLSGQVP